MPLNDDQVRQLVLDLLKVQTARDKQSLIGASEIGMPCDYCLARRLLGHKNPPGQYWLGAKLGTATHEYLEREEAKHLEQAQSYHFIPLEGAKIEEKVYLGEIPGYGKLYSRVDLALVNDRHLVDYKTTSTTNLQKTKFYGPKMQYQYQQNLYAWALNNMGIPIERYSLVYINREGSGDKDIWVWSDDYRPELAEEAWERLNLIWAWLQNDNNHYEELASHEDCYYCKVVLKRV